MENRILIIFVIICAFITVKSQDLLWQKRYIPERQEEQYYDRFYYPRINQIEDDILMINLIRVDTIQRGKGNTFLINRINSNGDTLWKRKFVMSFNVDYPIDLLKYNNDTFMIYGYMSYIKRFYSALFNNSGELIAEYYYEKSVGEIGSDIYVSKDFDFMISLDKLENISKFYKSNKDFVLKDSLILNFENEDTSIQYPMYLSSFKFKLRDNGYLITSHQYDIPFNYNYLIKTDSVLSVKWTQKYNSKLVGTDTSRFYFKYIFQKYDGSLLGIMNGIDPKGDSTFAIIHFDTTGNILLTKFYGKLLMFSDSKGKTRYSNMKVITIINTSDSGFVLGMDYRFPTIAKFDKDGELEWLRSYPVPDTNLPLGLEDIYQLTDNNFIMSLAEFDDKLDAPPPGVPLNTYLYKISNNTSAINDDIQEIQEIKIIPNPASNKMKIIFKGEQFNFTSLKIYNSMGVELTDLRNLINPNTMNELEINLSSFCNGVYYIIARDKYKFYSKSFVVLK